MGECGMFFLLGALGALAPEILRLYGLRGQGMEMKSWVFYLIASALFAGLGGTIALILPATTPWGAFYVGISTPLIVTQVGKRGLGLLFPETKGAISATRGQVSVKSKVSRFLNAL